MINQKHMHTIISTEDCLAQIAGILNEQDYQSISSFGLGSGKAGLILFYCHYAAFTKDETYYEKAEEILNLAFLDINPETYKAGFGTNFYQDLTEFGNLMMYLVSNGHLEYDTEPLLLKIDGFLADRLKRHLNNGNFEVVNGALAIGFYFIKRLSYTLKVQEHLDLLLDALINRKKGNELDGCCWECNLFGGPRAYTGLAHGNAMVINFLCALHEAGIRKAECELFIKDASVFLVKSRMDESLYGSSFPLWKGRVEETNNLCLIYGDLGVCYALIKGARLLDNESFYQIGLQTALLTTKRTLLKQTLLYDGSIWYGRAGAYLLYNHLFKQTGAPALREAAGYWLDGIIDTAAKDNPYLGFNSHFFGKSKDAQLSFNFGLIGIGLAQMQAISNDRYSIENFVWLS